MNRDCRLRGHAVDPRPIPDLSARQGQNQDGSSPSWDCTVLNSCHQLYSECTNAPFPHPHTSDKLSQPRNSAFLILNHWQDCLLAYVWVPIEVPRKYVLRPWFELNTWNHIYWAHVYKGLLCSQHGSSQVHTRCVQHGSVSCWFRQGMRGTISADFCAFSKLDIHLLKSILSRNHIASSSNFPRGRKYTEAF